MAPKLRDVIEKVLEVGKMTQPQLAVRLYGTEKKQGKISTMLGASDKSGWEKHWQVLSTLVIVAVQLKVLTERELLDVKSHAGSQQHNGGSKTVGTSASSRK